MSEAEKGYETIEVRRLEEGRVLALALAQPKANILSMAMMEELARALDAHANERALRLVVLSGQGSHFSFGASVPEHRAAEAPRMLATFHALARRIGSYPVPVAAAVEGKCLGGAFELVLASHFVFARADAVFACPEVKLGVFPPVLAALGQLRLGPLGEQLLIAGSELTAERGHAVGFVTSLVPAGASAVDAVLAWYRLNLAPLSAFALREATAAARQGSGVAAALGAPLAAAEQRYLERIVTSADGNEGIQAFLERRAPRWVDA
ncbi:MAG: enoyl-CoA hydratase/isomerase family protein [Polyangiaceae bacterium]|nr:enoyl-CoA hydratase/isomerase family protein [Polyangiaceae bacterium]